jgi:hypothetical protein
MKREEKFKSLEGQAAHLFYKAWMKYKHHTTTTHPESFKQSQYFNHFVNFVEFAKNTHLPDPNSFIELMVKNKIDPKFWTSAVAYGKYLEWVTRMLPAQKLIEVTVNTFFDFADEHEIPVGNIFEEIAPNDVIQMVQQRRISPWILLNSKKFAIFFRDKTNSEERVILESIINPDYWMKRFESHPDDLKLAKDCVLALEL